MTRPKHEKGDTATIEPSTTAETATQPPAQSDGFARALAPGLENGGAVEGEHKRKKRKRNRGVGNEAADTATTEPGTIHAPIGETSQSSTVIDGTIDGKAMAENGGAVEGEQRVKKRRKNRRPEKESVEESSVNEAPIVETTSPHQPNAEGDFAIAPAPTPENGGAVEGWETVKSRKRKQPGKEEALSLKKERKAKKRVGKEDKENEVPTEDGTEKAAQTSREKKSKRKKKAKENSKEVIEASDISSPAPVPIQTDSSALKSVAENAGLAGDDLDTDMGGVELANGTTSAIEDGKKNEDGKKRNNKKSERKKGGKTDGEKVPEFDWVPEVKARAQASTMNVQGQNLQTPQPVSDQVLRSGRDKETRVQSTQEAKTKPKKMDEQAKYRAKMWSYLSTVREERDQDAVDAYLAVVKDMEKKYDNDWHKLGQRLIDLHEELNRASAIESTEPSPLRPHTLIPVSIRTDIEKRLGNDFWVSNARYLLANSRIKARVTVLLKWLTLDSTASVWDGGVETVGDKSSENTLLAVTSPASNTHNFPLDHVISIVEIACRESKPRGESGEEVLTWYKYTSVGSVVREVTERRKERMRRVELEEKKKSGGEDEDEEKETGDAEPEPTPARVNSSSNEPTTNEEEWGGISVHENDNTAAAAEEEEDEEELEDAFETLNVEEAKGEGEESSEPKIRTRPILTIWLSRKAIPEFKEAFGEVVVKVARWKEGDVERVM